MYKKKTFKKKRSTRRKPRSGWVGTAAKALKLAKYVAGLVNAEAKDYYLNQGVFATSYNGNIVSLNGGITQGVADGQRTGDSVKLKTLSIRGDLARNGADDIVRVLVVWDKEDSVTISNLLQYVGSAQVTNSPKNDDTYYQSKILLDRRYIIDSDDPKRMFDFVVRINAHTKYNNTTNAIEDGALKIFFYSQQAATGTTIQFVSKLTFMDN